MNKLIWVPGVPKEIGMYWYSLSLRAHEGDKQRPLVLQIRTDDKDGSYGWCYGPFGSGPLEVYYNEKLLAKHVTHAKIPEPKKWVEMSTLKGNNNYGWFKDTKGHYGFGILDQGWGGKHYVTGSWIWANHPSCAADHGGDVQWKDGWKFSPIKVPEV